MKKIAFLLFLSLFAAGSFAQDYIFSTGTQTYDTLSAATLVSGNVVWDEEEFSIPLGFEFRFLRRLFTEVSIDGNGFLRFKNDSEILYYIAFGADMGSRGAGFSPISYQLTGVLGQRILKIEFKRAVFFSDQLPNSVNFQVWIYEGYNAIETHIGSITPNNDSLAYDGKGGPMIGIFVPDSALTTFTYSLGLSGNPASPGVGTMTIQNPDYLSGTPAKGTVYRFQLDIPAAVSPIENALRFSIYPNPAGSSLKIRSSINEKVEIRLLDISGREVLHLYQGVLQKDSEQILDLEGISAGLYLVSIKGETLNEVQKLIIR